MASQLLQLHFVLIPFMAPGHLIPMVDMARLLAQHGVIVTVVTTPLNATRFKSMIDRAVESGLQIHLLELQFPAVEAGLPEGCENVDLLPSRSLIRNFFVAASMLQQPLEQLFQELQPRPSCIISGKNLAWTADTARKFQIPRLYFDAMSCFAFSCSHNLEASKVHESISKLETFLVPGLPDQIELTKAQLPESLNPDSSDLTGILNQMRASESIADGIVVNTYEELEPRYVKEYKRIKGDKVWCIGPVSACNKLNLDKAERELGLGLEASNRPFIWVIRGGEKSKELERWILEEGFEERTEGRGLLIRGWAPQMLILSHPSIGVFLTHCGWNSTLEGVCTGVPILTCPLFAEQFINEKLVVQILGIGVSVGVESAVTWGMEEKFGVVMKREDVMKAIDEVMDKGEGGEKRRKRARELGEMAKKAIEEGGSSYLNMKRLIHYILQQTIGNPSTQLS
ncbi:UDP-glycosyltransferase 73C3 [Vitis vinifera]|uniref:Glycosyltransferase n=1 Tax=Vitis vinifera TaxID=29760 RepID=A0A438EJS2_VITVI|nr:UDP-glycosyltransferase 73C3 [Vitis vinifera]